MPYYIDNQLKKGSDVFPDASDNTHTLHFSKTILSKYKVPYESVVCCQMKGNSMEPAITDGSPVGIDTSRKELKDGELYAVNYDGELWLKVCFQRPGRKIRLRSYNADWEDEDVLASDVVILGRVFWWSVIR